MLKKNLGEELNLLFFLKEQVSSLFALVLFVVLCEKLTLSKHFLIPILDLWGQTAVAVDSLPHSLSSHLTKTNHTQLREASLFDIKRRVAELSIVLSLSTHRYMGAAQFIKANCYDEKKHDSSWQGRDDNVNKSFFALFLCVFVSFLSSHLLIFLSPPPPSLALPLPLPPFCLSLSVSL